MSEAFIVDATRTAGGKRGGCLASWHPVDLAAAVLDELADRNLCDFSMVDDVIMGCVTQAGEQSFNIGRNAVIASRLPDTVPATTVDRQCGSSQQAVQFAAQAVMSGAMDIVIAAGVESMTRAPMGMAITVPAGQGYGVPRGKRIDERFPGQPFDQFAAAEAAALRFGLTKGAMDAFALQSHQRAAEARRAGRFTAEILPVQIDGGMHQHDEGIRDDTSLQKITAVRPLQPGGRISAATASQICDGASGILVMNASGLRRTGATPIARIAHMSVIGCDPVHGLDSPVVATRAVLARAGMKLDEIDLYEISEAFAAVPLAWLRETGGDPSRLNIHGGAIALGHPLGSSGTRLLTTLVYALRGREAQYGLQAMCEGAGMANALIVERLQ